MEGLILLGIIAIVVATGFAFATMGVLWDARAKERSNVEELDSLRRKLSAQKDKLQSIRMGEYSPNEEEQWVLKATARGLQKETGPIDTCYFCDQPIDLEALVCRHCSRPNALNLSGISKNDSIVREILENGG